jgi:hypothetical protein
VEIGLRPRSGLSGRTTGDNQRFQNPTTSLGQGLHPNGKEEPREIVQGQVAAVGKNPIFSAFDPLHGSPLDASIPMLFTKWFFLSPSYPLSFFILFCLATFGPSSMYIFSQRILYPDWKKRFKYLPFLMCLGTGISVNNTKAIFEALFGLQSDFIRTPKYGIERKEDTWYGKLYTIPFSFISLVELFLGLYSLACLLLFLLFSKYFISPFLLIYSAGFLYVFSLSVMQAHPHTKKN